ncbi:hypothetical protein OS493_014929, partial [Desmophyllum pertusum]
QHIKVEALLVIQILLVPTCCQETGQYECIPHSELLSGSCHSRSECVSGTQHVPYTSAAEAAETL